MLLSFSEDFLAFLPFQPRKTDISLRSPGTRPSYLQSRLSITSQTSLRRSASQASYIFLPDSDMFPSTTSLSPSTPRTPLSTISFLPPDSVSETISESPLLEDTEPDYVNIENFPEQEPPPDIPPRKPSNQTKHRAASVNGDRPSEHVTSPVRRQMSDIIPSIPRKPTKSVTIDRCQNIAQDDAVAPPAPCSARTRLRWPSAAPAMSRLPGRDLNGSVVSEITSFMGLFVGLYGFRFLFLGQGLFPQTVWPH